MRGKASAIRPTAATYTIEESELASTSCLPAQAAPTKGMAKLYFNYSTMNAGKSTVLLQASHNYNERGGGFHREVQHALFKPDLNLFAKV